MNDTQPTVLVCPLDWGLGHATRCIPIIGYLLENGYKVNIVGYGQSLTLLKQAFPNLKHHHLKGFTVKYSNKGLSWVHFVAQLPTFLYFKWAEHYHIKKLANHTKASYIISDNRYGLYHKHIPSFIITHQLNPIMPNSIRWAEKPVHAIIKQWTKRFHKCLIPDFNDHRNLAGKLTKSASTIENIGYIGHLSRFTHADHSLALYFPPIKQNNWTKGHDQSTTLPMTELAIPDEPFLLAIVSGPEPQRSLFSQSLQQQAASLPTMVIIVEGLPNHPFNIKNKGNAMVIPHIDTPTMQKLIAKSQMVVCRAGYTTIMDLGCFDKKAILVPTPGQTEQIYLAQSLYSKGQYYAVDQDNFNMKQDTARALAFYMQ